MTAFEGFTDFALTAFVFGKGAFFETFSGFEGLTAGFALPFWAAVCEVVFFAAMAQRCKMQMMDDGVGTLEQDAGDGTSAVG
ncbi:MAG: hypothetical protein ACRCXD_10340 [Luteolibacter sp.]